MKASETIRAQLKALLQSQKLGVLSTHERGQPYASLVAYAVSDSLDRLLFTTARGTRKFANLTADSRVAILITNSVNAVEDFHQASAVTAMGRAWVLPAEEADAYMPLYLSRHPYLKAFASSPTTEMISIAIRRYIMVKQFQKVIEIDIAPTLDSAP
ncbi:MAG: pyridoxamine 5'-phosphate oxidase family protein [Desulfobacterales bacterium]|jgi:nitroimidazol reductase NimA-like FMN-containing flavoprotein (pyridoxamine 5'-phosphate oxidase superfamily)